MRRERGGAMIRQIGWFAIVAATVLVAAQGAPRSEQKEVKLLPWSQQIAVREQWLAKRHTMLLGMMRRNRVEMWIVVNEEFHNDPLTEFIAPPRPYCGRQRHFCVRRHGRQRAAEDRPDGLLRRKRTAIL